MTGPGSVAIRLQKSCSECMFISQSEYSKPASPQDQKSTRRFIYKAET